MYNVGSAGKIIRDYVIRRFNASLARAQEARGTGPSLGPPLGVISRFTWSPETSEARPLFKAPHEEVSSFRADLGHQPQVKRRL